MSELWRQWVRWLLHTPTRERAELARNRRVRAERQLEDATGEITVCHTEWRQRRMSTPRRQGGQP